MKKTSWKRIIGVILGTFVGLWILCLAGTHVWLVTMTRGMTKDLPGIEILPHTPPDTTLADLSGGQTLSAFGYQIRSPWPKLNAGPVSSPFALFRLEGGRMLVVNDPAKYSDFVTELKQGDEQTRSAANDVYGKQALSSHLSLLTAEMNARPCDAGIFHSRHANARAATFLTMKSLQLMMSHSGNALYEIHTGHMRGFQFGNPLVAESTKKSIHLLLVDENDNVLEMHLYAHSPGSVTQPQINAMIASIQPPA